MVAILTSAPQAEPVTLDEARLFARIDGTAEDAAVTQMIRAARTDVESRTGRALVTQGWRIVRDGVPRGGVVRLAPAPVQTVYAVTVYGDDGAPQVVPAADYEVDLASSPGRLVFSTSWAGRAVNGLEIDLTAGYGAPAAVPAPLKHAILMLVAYWYEQREAALVGAVAGPVANGVAALCAPYRMARLA